MDDAFRHSITKLSQIHFASNKILGIELYKWVKAKKCIFIRRSRIESIKNTQFLSKKPNRKSWDKF